MSGRPKRQQGNKNAASAVAASAVVVDTYMKDDDDDDPESLFQKYTKQTWKWAEWLQVFTAPGADLDKVMIESVEGIRVLYKDFYLAISQGIRYSSVPNGEGDEYWQLDSKQRTRMQNMLQGLPLSTYWIWIPSGPIYGVAFYRTTEKNDRCSGCRRISNPLLDGECSCAWEENSQTYGMVENAHFARELEDDSEADWFRRLKTVLLYGSNGVVEPTLMSPRQGSITGWEKLVYFTGGPQQLLQPRLDKAYFSCYQWTSYKSDTGVTEIASPELQQRLQICKKLVVTQSELKFKGTGYKEMPLEDQPKFEYVAKIEGQRGFKEAGPQGNANEVPESPQTAPKKRGRPSKKVVEVVDDGAEDAELAKEPPKEKAVKAAKAKVPPTPKTPKAAAPAPAPVAAAAAAGQAGPKTDRVAFEAEVARRLAPKRVKIDASSPIVLPCMIEQEFVHPQFGPVQVTAELWYVAEEQPDHVKSRPSGYERYYQPIDPNRKKKQHVAGVRVVYYHKIHAISPNHSPLSAFVDEWFSSLNASTVALGNSDSGWKAWSLRDSKDKYTLGQATSVNGFRNHLAIVGRPLTLPPVPHDPHVLEGDQCKLCRKMSPLVLGEFAAEGDWCPLDSKDLHRVVNGQCELCGTFGTLPYDELCNRDKELLHTVENGRCTTCGKLGTLPPTAVCSKMSRTPHVRRGGYCAVCRKPAPKVRGAFPPGELCPCNTDRFCFRLSQELRSEFYDEEDVFDPDTGDFVRVERKIKPRFDGTDYPRTAEFYQTLRTDWWHCRELHKSLGEEVPVADYLGAQCRFECNEFLCVPSDDHVGPFQCVHGLWHEPYAEPSKREDKDGPMFYVPRSAALVESDDDELLMSAGMAACAMDESEGAGGGGGAGGEAASSKPCKKKAAGGGKRKKANKPQRQYKDHVFTPWDARIQFTRLPTLSWADARHEMIKAHLGLRLDQVRATPVLESSMPLMRTRRVTTLEEIKRVTSYWRRAPMQPYPYNPNNRLQHFVCDLRNPHTFLPQYQRANSATFGFLTEELTADLQNIGWIKK